LYHIGTEGIKDKAVPLDGARAVANGLICGWEKAIVVQPMRAGAGRVRMDVALEEMG
jgi:hypothetical protein